MPLDSAGHEFIDTPTLSGEHVRTTRIPGDIAGYGVDTVRIQIRDASGHLRPGPEIPVEQYLRLLGLSLS